MRGPRRPPDSFLPHERRTGGDPVASGGTLDLVGRAAELERVDRLLDGARGGRPGLLVVEGDAGVGKTAVLQAAAARARGFGQVTARGVESEAALPHAALGELLGPLRPLLGEVPPGQAAALAAALGWGPADVPGDRHLVAAGTLSLLAAAALRAPLLVVVDDLQWVDPESAAAVLFAARRVHGDRTAVLLARRPGADPPAGASVLRLADLDPAAVAELLAGAVAGPVARRLGERLGGNPLALLEVAGALSAGQRAGREPLPATLPAGPVLTAALEPELAALPPGARLAVLLLAAADDGRAGTVAAALARAGTDAEAALDAAEDRRVVVRSGDALGFRHPVLRSLVWSRAAPADRRRAHLLLAETARTGDDDARTWHRALATTGPDEALAGELAALAGRVRGRRGASAASAALERAAALTRDATRAAELLAAAVRDAAVGGDAARARSLAERVLRAEAPAAARAEVLHVLGRVEQDTGSVPAARDLLQAAAGLATGRTAAWVLADLALVQHRLGDVAGMQATARRASAATDDPDPLQRALAAWVTGMAAVHRGDPGTGRSHLQRALDTAEAHAGSRADPRLLPLLTLAVGWLPDPLAAVPVVERRLREVRDVGALGVLVAVLAMTAHGRAHLLGDHAGAFADAGEAVELAGQLGYVADAAPALELLAWEYAARGRHEEAAAHLERARALVVRAGTAGVAAHLALTAAACALCRGDPAGAARLLEERRAVDGGAGALGEPLGIAPLLVETWQALGRQAEAAALAEDYARASRPALPATAALVARCRALACPDDAAATVLFERALAAHGQAPDRFEEAHTRLLFGERLRRSGQRTRAREELTAAADAFAAADMAYWAGRAEGELAATGRTARPRRPLPEEPLTPQETRIAVLAARGASNREIAAELFLSPKTVEHHLGSVYRKRGLRSRVQLARLLG
ncbi:Response regulator containing a CheY-like receiver domain and an HTH DNA-binding domain [Geodermatophilus telluris]|uniref:Response regulator containing a CheY-like receiver domain and an HTH DNA-binding domain n=1 Tax=Geodermatophilus telluris TaxID=1190417 RepID=A0A1G6V968_9ACTN|nr:LuxR family transcriptional regulator [Geodermatophilus telluris]SDD50250.1 Response regulator containing a CheY-like receiver domain and an HTH DNA-binding domain [Geodermatophilus telluris]